MTMVQNVWPIPDSCSEKKRGKAGDLYLAAAKENSIFCPPTFLAYWRMTQASRCFTVEIIFEFSALRKELNF